MSDGPEITLLNDLVSWWSLNEASGTRNDSHGGNHLSDVNTVGSAMGKVGNAGDFVRTNSERLELSDSSDYDVSGSFTISGWFYKTTTGAAVLASVWNEDGVDERGWRVQANTETNIRLQTSRDGTFGTTLNTANATISNGTWYWFCAWYDASDDKLYMSIDNATPVASASTTSAVYQAPGKLIIGGQETGSGGSQHWGGLIDEVGFWTRVLTSDERTWLYNSASGRAYSDLDQGGGQEYQQAVDGAVTFAGVTVKRAGKPAAGEVSFAGETVRHTGKALAGAVTYASDLLRNVARKLAGAVSFAGDALRQKVVVDAGEVAPNNHQYVRYANNSNSYTLSNYAVPAGANKVLAVTVSLMLSNENGVNINGVSFDGDALTPAVASTGTSTSRSYYIGTWILVNPATKTGNIVVSLTGNHAGCIISAVTLTGVDQTTPFSHTGVTSVTLDSTSFDENDPPYGGDWTGTPGDYYLYAVASNASNNPTWAWDDFGGTAELYDLNNGSSSNNEVAGSGASGAPSGGWAWVTSDPVTPPRTVGVAVGFVAAAVSQEYEKEIGGAVTFAGVTIRLPNKALAGATTPAGELSRDIGKLVAGAVSLAGSIVRDSTHSLAGAVSAAGDVVRQTAKPLAGAWSAAGNISRRVSKRLAAELSFDGTIEEARAFLYALAGSLSFDGGVRLQPWKVLRGAWSAAGNISRQTMKPLGGAWAAAGTVSRAVTRSLSGALALAGNVSRHVTARVSGAVAFTSTVTRQMAVSLSSALNLSGLTETARFRFVALAGALTSAGSLVRHVATSRVSGAVAFSGEIVRRVSVLLSGSLDMAGATGRFITRALSGTLATAGTVARRISRQLGGAVSWVGSVLPVHYPGGFAPGIVHLTARARSLVLTARKRIFTLTARKK